MMQIGIGLGGVLLLLALICASIFLIRKKQRCMLEGLTSLSLTPVLVENQGRITLSDSARQFLELREKGQEITAIDQLSIRLDPEDSQKFQHYVQDLRDTGQSFVFEAQLKDQKGRVLLDGRALGRRFGGGFFIGIENRSSQVAFEAAQEKLLQQNRLFRHILDHIPLPVWWRYADDLNLAGVNKVYAELLEAAPDLILQEQRELGAGVIAVNGKGLARRAIKFHTPQSESHVIAIKGKRRLLDMTESYLGEKAGHLVGYAEDMTALDEIQAQLATHLAAHDEVLDDLKSAIVIFGPDKILKYYNKSFLRLFLLREEEIQSGLNYGALLDLLRDKRLLPEVIDFPVYKKQWEALFTKLIERRDEMVHLPDGRTLQQSVLPHPLGGLMVLIDDVTDVLALESNFNTLIAVQQATLNNLHEAVSVWGSDGRLKIWNRMFEDIWSFDPEKLSGDPHITTIFKMIMDDWSPTTQQKDQDVLLNRVAMDVTNRVSRAYDLTLKDQRAVSMALVPLPDAQVLMIHWDVTDTKNVEQALAEKKGALERADLLKSQFLSNISYELRTPINAIQGFATLLKEEFFGKLNPRQMDHVQNILDAGEDLTQLVKDILELAVIQADLLELEKGPADVTLLLGKAVEQVSPLAQSKNQVLNFESKLDKAPILCDEERLLRGFQKVIDTVIRYSNGKNIQITLRPASEWEEAELPQTGYEILLQTDSVLKYEEEQEDLLNRFMGNDPQALRTGVGLNLSLAKNLLGLHQGKIEIDVTNKKGFEVMVQLETPDFDSTDFNSPRS